MGWLQMSKQELRRVEVLTEVLAGSRTTESAAGVLGVSLRQAQRLVARYRDGGGGALIHKGRGRPASNKLDKGVRELVLELVRQNYRDFGPTLAAEVLLERHGIEVSRETLRKWMVESGVWLSRKQRRSFHQPRLRRESLGELIQIDGSQHRWFEDRGEPCTLLVFIDDATSSLMQLRFVPSESTGSYFEALQGYLATHGCPVAFYSDKHSVFRINRDAQGGSGMTQFGRALAELNIEIICANSSQAKGRVERANRTLQDRLVKELRLAGVSGMESGNAFLPGFVERYNERFAVRATSTTDLHRPLSLKPQKLNDILCHREQRYVGAQLTFHYDRKQIILEQTELSKGLAGRYVELYHYPDGPLEVRWKGHTLPYRVFRKDQRVSHTAIVENKRLGHALAIVKAQQDLKLATKVMTNSVRKRARPPRWKCRSDGKGGTIKPSHPPHRPWKPPENGGSHITHREDGDEGSKLTFLLCTPSDSSALHQHGSQADLKRLPAHNRVEIAAKADADIVYAATSSPDQIPMPDHASLAPYAHWMLHEIHQQPATLTAGLDHYVDSHGFHDEVCKPVLDWLKAAKDKIVITASGSSRHAGMVAEILIEDASGIPVDVEYASEYGLRAEKTLPRQAVLVVSQSGETADTLGALRKANLAGHPTLAITNVHGSTMDREATASFPTLAGRERAIPATKSFTGQLLNLYLLSLLSGLSRGTMDEAQVAAALGDAAKLPQSIGEQLAGWEQTMRRIAGEYRTASNFLFLGRGIHYPIAREGALKLKESAYLHAEGYPSGELKHGPNALVAEGTPLVMIATVDRADEDSVQRYQKVVQLMRDMREQGADMLAVANTGDEQVASLANHTVFVEEMREPLLAIAEVVPMQLFSYFMAVGHGIDVDHPRNLTKAVLAE